MAGTSPCIITGLKGQEGKIFSGGSMAIDLTQTSYSSILIF